jgi:hypothetical protein
MRCLNDFDEVNFRLIETEHLEMISGRSSAQLAAIEVEDFACCCRC